MINPDLAFLLVAGIAFLGFILDALFDRLRITSVLPLMLLGVLLVHFGWVPRETVVLLNAFIPYVSALTVAFILFSVGLEIRFGELSRVFGRATAFTLSVQVASGLGIAYLAYATFHWQLLVSLIFGFGLSGPSSISVPVLVRVARMPDALRTTLLFESVFSDVLQLLVPLTMIGFLTASTVTPASVAGSLTLTILGSAGGGVAAGLFWLAFLDRLRAFAKGYTWTLTITMVIATYGVADLLHLSAAITIFIFGLLIGNSLLLDSANPAPRTVAPRQSYLFQLHDLRRFLGLSTFGLDIKHIQQVQKEVSFFASSFFFVYIGLLFEVQNLTPLIIAVPLLAALLMIVVRFPFTWLLVPLMDPEPASRRSEQGLTTFNIPRGLAAAIIATVPLSMGIVIPGFLDAMFLAILFSTVLSTIGIFLLYRPDGASPPSRPAEEEPLAGRPPAAPVASDLTPRAEPPPPARRPAGEPPAPPPPPLPRPRSPRERPPAPPGA
jgi:Na+:H+ antiporter